MIRFRCNRSKASHVLKGEMTIFIFPVTLNDLPTVRIGFEEILVDKDFL